MVECPDFPYLGLWTADKPFDTGYFCIEPWSALPDAVFVGRGLEVSVTGRLQSGNTITTEVSTA